MAYNSKTGSEYIARDFAADLARGESNKRTSYSTALENIEKVFAEFDNALSPKDSLREDKTPFILNFEPEPISKILKEARENIESAEMLRPSPERRKREMQAISMMNQASKAFGYLIDKLNEQDPITRAAVHKQLGDGKLKRAIEGEESMTEISKSLKEMQRQNSGTNRYFGF